MGLNRGEHVAGQFNGQSEAVQESRHFPDRRFRIVSVSPTTQELAADLDLGSRAAKVLTRRLCKPDKYGRLGHNWELDN